MAAAISSAAFSIGPSEILFAASATSDNGPASLFCATAFKSTSVLTTESFSAPASFFAIADKTRLSLFFINCFTRDFSSPSSLMAFSIAAVRFFAASASCRAASVSLNAWSISITCLPEKPTCGSGSRLSVTFSWYSIRFALRNFFLPSWSMRTRFHCPVVFNSPTVIATSIISGDCPSICTMASNFITPKSSEALNSTGTVSSAGAMIFAAGEVIVTVGG